MRKKRRAHSRFISDLLESRQLLSIYYVDANAPGTTQNGFSWETAYTDLQSALVGKAVMGDTIRVADGTYKPTSTTDRNVSFNMIIGVGVYGGYAGYGATNPHARDAALYPTILSGDIGTPGTKTDNSFQVVNADSIFSTLDGLTITLGGTGIYAKSSSLTVTNCAFTANTGPKGGIYFVGTAVGTPLDYARLNVSNCTFTGNSASFGGGIGIDAYTTATIANCSFSGNSATYGGGFWQNSSTTATLTQCVFSNNTATKGGGIAFNSTSEPSATLSLTQCTFTGNTVTQYGGGIFNENYASPTITHCSFVQNKSSVSGGGIYNSSSSTLPTLLNCIFTGNTAGNTGGGYCGGAASLTQCLFSGNSSPKGGGIASKTDLINCTLVGNQSSTSGAAYYALGTSTLTNCILWNNGASAIFGGPTISYSDVEGGYDGTTNINSDPLLVRLPAIGADNLWGTADDDYGDLRLKSGSPCLDVGLNSANTQTVDLIGNARVKNIVIDLGVHEGFVSVAPKTIYVDMDASGANTGESWENAFLSLQSALAVAIDGDTIKIATGTYTPTDTADRTISFNLVGGVKIYGGYAGVGAADPEARDPALYPSFLSGEVGNPASQSDNSYHVVVGSSINSSTLLDGVTITLGYANGATNDQKCGGGLFLISASPTLNNCTFSINTASSGGGIYCKSSSPMITNCTIDQKTATSSGIYNSYSTPTIQNCLFVSTPGTCIYNYYSPSTISNCIFSGTSGSGVGIGCGIYNNQSSPSISNCVFSKITSNTSSGGGGITNLYYSSPIVSNCVFDGNAFLKINSNGTIYNFSYSSPTFNNCSFTNNQASKGACVFSEGFCKPTFNDCSFSGNLLNQGGTGAVIMMFDRSDATLNHCSFIGNNTTSKGSGGAAYISSDSSASFNDCEISANKGSAIYSLGTITLSNCTLSSNSSSNGGGIYFASTKTSSLTNCTLSGNSAVSGGGIYCASSSGPLTLTNCSLTNNSASVSGGALYNTASLTNCSLTNNSASVSGGALYNTASSPALINCVFLSNSAPSGGGLYNISSSAPRLTNCTLVENTGYALYNTSSSPVLVNCILWNNPSGAVFNSSSTPNITYTDIQGGYTGTGNKNADPLFVRNPFPGADAVWGTPDDDTGDLRLQISSPCLNAGLNSANTTPTDLAGNTRILNTTIELGAYETLIPFFLAGTTGNDLYTARLSPDQSTLQIWTSSNTTNSPTYSYPLNSITTLYIDLLAGADTLGLDISNGANLPISLLNIETVNIISANNASLALTATHLTLNSSPIAYTGATAFQIQSDTKSLNSISLIGNVALKFLSPQFVIQSGDPQTLRQYIYNAATGSKPAFSNAGSTSIALLDNSKLHKTSFAGLTLAAPFSQLLICPAKPGDANLDGVVDSNDLLAVFANLNKTDTTWLNGDVDQSGTVDLADLAIVQSKLPTSSLSVASATQNKAKAKTPSIKTAAKPKPRHKIVHKS